MISPINPNNRHRSVLAANINPENLQVQSLPSADGSVIFSGRECLYTMKDGRTWCIKHKHKRIYIYIHLYTHVYMYIIYIYVYICMYIYICVCVRRVLKQTIVICWHFFANDKRLPRIVYLDMLYRSYHQVSLFQIGERLFCFLFLSHVPLHMDLTVSVLLHVYVHIVALVVIYCNHYIYIYIHMIRTHVHSHIVELCMHIDLRKHDHHWISLGKLYEELPTVIYCNYAYMQTKEIMITIESVWISRCNLPGPRCARSASVLWMP